MAVIRLPKVDNRDMAYVIRYIDSRMESVKNEFWNGLLAMNNTRPLAEKNGQLYCPACGRFYSVEHSVYQPNFCEDCGQAFEWTNNFQERG